MWCCVLLYVIPLLMVLCRVLSHVQVLLELILSSLYGHISPPCLTLVSKGTARCDLLGIPATAGHCSHILYTQTLKLPSKYCI